MVSAASIGRSPAPPADDLRRRLGPLLGESSEGWSVALSLAAARLGTPPEEVLATLEAQSFKRSLSHAQSRAGATLVLGLTGPGAVGKDTLIRQLASEPDLVDFVVFSTTRPKRPSEAEGVDYNFIGEARFTRLESARAFAYTRTIEGRGRYGLRMEEVLRRPQARIRLLREAPRNLIALEEILARNAEDSAFAISYLLPPSPAFETLLDRALARAAVDGGGGPEQLSNTLRPYNALHFLSAVELFERGHNVVFLVNDDVARVAGRLRELATRHLRPAPPTAGEPGGDATTGSAARSKITEA